MGKASKRLLNHAGPRQPVACAVCSRDSFGGTNFRLVQLSSTAVEDSQRGTLGIVIILILMIYWWTNMINIIPLEIGSWNQFLLWNRRQNCTSLISASTQIQGISWRSCRYSQYKHTNPYKLHQFATNWTSEIHWNPLKSEVHFISLPSLTQRNPEIAALEPAATSALLALLSRTHAASWEFGLRWRHGFAWTKCGACQTSSWENHVTHVKWPVWGLYFGQTHNWTTEHPEKIGQKAEREWNSTRSVSHPLVPFAISMSTPLHPFVPPVEQASIVQAHGRDSTCGGSLVFAMFQFRLQGAIQSL